MPSAVWLLLANTAGLNPTQFLTAHKEHAMRTLVLATFLVLSTAPISGAQLTLTDTPSAGNAPLTVTFVATCAQCVVYTWDFGDGSGPALPPGPDQTHTYVAAGTYNVLVAASDKLGHPYIGTAVITATQCSALTPCTRTDTAVITAVAPPQLGANSAYYGGHSGAGLVAIDPAYGNKILRVTDGSSYSAQPGQSFWTPSSAEHNMTSYDETMFFVSSGGGLYCLYQFDAATFSAAARGCFNLGKGGDFGYTQADNNAFYAYSNNLLYRYLINTTSWTITKDPTFNNGQGYFDPNGPQCLDGKITSAAKPWYTGDFALSSDDNTVITDIGPEQDEDPYVIVWNAAKGCSWINVQTWQASNGWNAGLTNPLPITFESGKTYASTGGMHNVNLDRSGVYGVLAVNGAGIPHKLFWSIGTQTIDDTCVQCTSHWACDFGNCLWQFDASGQHSGFSMSTSDIGSTSFDQATNPGVDVGQYGNDSHMSHANASLSQQVPYLVAYAPTAGGSTVTQTWADELVGVAWNGTETAYRFNKNWSSGYGGFNSAVRCVISRQGTYAICNSDYQMYNLNKGFGDGLKNDTCDHTKTAGVWKTAGSCRIDVLLFDLATGL
jgi:hypothetical protein